MTLTYKHIIKYKNTQRRAFLATTLGRVNRHREFQIYAFPKADRAHVLKSLFFGAVFALPLFATIAKASDFALLDARFGAISPALPG